MLLAACMGTLYSQARRQEQWGPFVVGLTAGGVIFVAKFMIEVDLFVYGGVGGLVLAFYWSLRKTPNDTCSTCEPSEGAI